MGAFDGLILGSLVLDAILMLITHFVLTKRESEGDFHSKKRIEYELVTCISIVLVTLGAMVSIANIFHWESDLFNIHADVIEPTFGPTTINVNEGIEIRDITGDVHVYVNGDSGIPDPTIVDGNKGTSSILPTPTMTSTSTPSPAPAHYAFKDTAIEKCIRKAIGVSSGEPLYESDLARVRELNATNDGHISSLDDLEYCINLEVLLIEGNKVTDIKPLTKLKHLYRLNLRNNKLTDDSISWLSYIPTLTDLSISGNGISDISCLSGLKRLKGLYLNGNKINDFSPLYGLTNLEVLFVDKADMRNSGQLETLASKLPNCDIKLRNKG